MRKYDQQMYMNDDDILEQKRNYRLINIIVGVVLLLIVALTIYILRNAPRIKRFPADPYGLLCFVPFPFFILGLAFLIHGIVTKKKARISKLILMSAFPNVIVCVLPKIYIPLLRIMMVYIDEQMFQIAYLIFGIPGSLFIIVGLIWILISRKKRKYGVNLYIKD